MRHWYLGTIGFSYKEWVGEFYPKGSSQHEYLPYYCKVFNTLEVDTTFHSIPQPETVAGWYATAPQDFIFCLKTPQVITHELRLKNAQGLMTEFITAIAPLQEKAGPILIQLPPSYTQENYSTLDDFLGILPSSHRYAVEFRHPSWYNDKTRQLLESRRVCWASIDYPRLPRQIVQTTDFLYFRWIGINGIYHIHSYERVDQTDQLKAWLSITDPYLDKVPAIYGFFNNDYAGFAAGTCKRFMHLVGLATNEPDLPSQGKLF